MAEGALGSVHDQAVLVELFEETLKIEEMFFEGERRYEYIVDINVDMGNVLEDFIHKSLKILAGIL